MNMEIAGVTGADGYGGRIRHFSGTVITLKTVVHFLLR